MIRIDPGKCVGCNACIRACPVNDANVAETENGRCIISINDSNCIHCGECTKECTHGARYFDDDTEAFFRDLGSRQIAVLVTPAIRVAFRDNWWALLNWLRGHRNVSGIYDVSFGADICTYMHLKAVKEKRVGKIISQPCAALTDYILKYNHKLIPYLSPIHSPIMCAAIYLRKYCGVNHPIAVLSPCIAKKTEFMDTGVVSVYTGLKKYLEDKNVKLGGSPAFEFDGLPALSGAIYPMPGGLKECLLAMNPKLNVINSEGVPAVYHNLEKYANTPDAKKPDVFDVLSCEYGCISGPGVSSDISYFDMMDAMSTVKSQAFEKQEKQKNLFKKNRQYLKFDSQLKLEDFVRTYQPKHLNLPDITERDLDAAFKSLYKYTPEERRVDCQACGYSTCRNMAVAIARGVNFPENCHQYILKSNLKEQVRIRENADRAMAVQQRINELSGELAAEVAAMTSHSDSIISNARETSAAVDDIQRTVQHFQTLSSAIVDNIAQINNINKEYVNSSRIIDDIALQINILSINVSIEAARAGDAGKGFAVVAREVGVLAGKTQLATQGFEHSSAEVATNTGTIKVSIEDIFTAVNRLSDTLSSLKDVFEATGRIGHEIYKVSEDVRAIADRINTTINQ